VAAALLTGCGASQPPIGATGTMPQNRAPEARDDSANYKVLYNFRGRQDGWGPAASLIDVNGKLYGTTAGGGSTCKSGCGTVFGITTGGIEKVLYRFRKDPDGAYPEAGLIEVKGTLYGTTWGGGKRLGTVFSLTTSGAENVLHRFASPPDGALPPAPLIEVGGTLYGTTGKGGTYGGGTIFSVTTNGAENVLHSFPGQPDGALPAGPLINVGGTLYGTTGYGGDYGNGTIFTITTSGTEKVLYSFKFFGTDGVRPVAGLVDVGGTLYGTTSAGGTSNNGTVFSITTSGTEKVLYSFGSGTDGSDPEAGLTALSGALYGTTDSGGTSNNGTVFSITTNGRETVMHDFSGGSHDGAHPLARLIDVGGVLYGTTDGGGSGCRPFGCGTVFALSP
jgi:uncharacterized repeat protein (TIGR03803 family)